MNCCDTKNYDAVFGEKRARSDLKRYRKKGPAKTTRLLIDALKGAGVEDRTLLDIGGGIGAIANALLAAGADSAVHVEAADAFIGAAREEATRRGNEARVRFVRGDFVALAAEIPPADIVTLDRVICCYPDMEQLVTTSVTHARRAYGIVIPRARRLSRMMGMGINLIFRIFRNPFRFHLHPPQDIERLIARAGLSLHSARETAIWRVAVFIR
jgi:magnesium-protoporphyrin O-methyltransferase